jgi:hypothetical protein
MIGEYKAYLAYYDVQDKLLFDKRSCKLFYVTSRNNMIQQLVKQTKHIFDDCLVI